MIRSFPTGELCAPIPAAGGSACFAGAVTNTDDWRFDGLRALFINGTLKKSPEPSNTQGLIDISRAIMDKHGVQTSVLRAVDHDIATGVWPDMTEHGWASDAWPAIQDRKSVV